MRGRLCGRWRRIGRGWGGGEPDDAPGDRAEKRRSDCELSQEKSEGTLL